MSLSKGMLFSCTSSYPSTRCRFCFPLWMNTSIILECSCKNDSYPKAMTRAYKGKFVSKCHFQISSLGTLGPFKFSSQKSVSSKAALSSAVMNELPSNIIFTQVISHVHGVQTAVSFYGMLLIK